MAEQLGLNLPSRTALGRDAFFEAPSNATALRSIERWPDWDGGKLVLTGPSGSGKTHLAHVWGDLSGAPILTALDLPDTDVPALATQPGVAVEDVPDIAGHAEAEQTLFHLHNLLLSEGKTLLLTGTSPVAQWAIALPDLASRLQGTVAVAMEPPDDTLLSAVLLKLLADRQLTPKANLIPYLLSRMDRSFAAAIDLVEQLDAASLAQGKPLSRHLAGRVLDTRDDPT